jgi:hypothetical protein
MTGIEAAIAAVPAWVTTTASLVSTAVGVVSAISGGQSQAAMAQYNAQVAENQATATRQAAAAQEAQQRRKSLQLLSMQQAAIGASGATVEGSPLLDLADAASQAELDARTIRWQGEVGAQRAESQAQLDRMQGDAALRAGYFGAASSLLTGVSRLAKTTKAGTASGTLSVGDG